MLDMVILILCMYFYISFLNSNTTNLNLKMSNPKFFLRFSYKTCIRTETFFSFRCVYFFSDSLAFAADHSAVASTHRSTTWYYAGTTHKSIIYVLATRSEREMRKVMSQIIQPPVVLGDSHLLLRVRL